MPESEKQTQSAADRNENHSLVDQMLEAIDACRAAQEGVGDNQVPRAEPTQPEKSPAEQPVEHELVEKARLDPIQRARAAGERFRAEQDELGDRYLAALSIPIDKSITRFASRAPWAYELQAIYNRATPHSNKLKNIAPKAATPESCKKLLLSALPSARELTFALVQLSKIDPVTRNQPAAQLIRYGPSILAIAAGSMLLLLLNVQGKRVLEAALAERAVLARVATQKAANDLVIADVVLRKFDADSVLPKSGDQTALLGRLASAHTRAGTALDQLNRIQSVASENTLPQSSILAVDVSESTGLMNVASVMEKRLAGALFADSSDARKSRRKWLTSMRDYRTSLGEGVVSLACASQIALNLRSDSVKVCSVENDLQTWSKEGPPKIPFLLLSDGFRGRTRQDFVVKLLFALAFVFIGGGVIIFLGKLLGIIDSKSSIERLISEFTGKDFRSVLTAWPLIAPIGLFAGLTAGGYALAEPSIEREPAQEERVSPYPIARADTAHLAHLAHLAQLRAALDSIHSLHQSVDSIRDTANDISNRAR